MIATLIYNMPAILVVLPIIAACICAVLPCRLTSWVITSFVTLAIFIISFILMAVVADGTVISYAMGNWPAPLGIEYRVDRLNAFILLIVSAIALFSSIYAYSSINNEIEKTKQPLFYAAFLLCIAGLLGITITNDAFNIYVFLEISSLATYVLIAMGSDRRALVASFEYLILGTIGATFILIAIGLLYMMLGTLNISDMATRMADVAYTTPVKAALAFFVVGLFLKIAMFPLHLWLANSYTNAPSVISSFLSATATKVSIYVIIRLLFDLFGQRYTLDAMKLGEVIITLSIFAVFIGSFVAMFQRNIKRMLAYSSVAQVGYIMLGVSLATTGGLSAAVIFMFNHAIAKAALFMAAGAVMMRTGGVRIADFRGIAAKMPVTCTVFVIAGLSIIGIPFTGGFISKLNLLYAIADSGLWHVFVVVIISSLLSLVYIWRIIELAYFGDISKDNMSVREAPFAMLLPMLILALLVIVFGVYPQPVEDIAGLIAGDLLKVK